MIGLTLIGLAIVITLGALITEVRSLTDATRGIMRELHHIRIQNETQDERISRHIEAIKEERL